MIEQEYLMGYEDFPWIYGQEEYISPAFFSL